MSTLARTLTLERTEDRATPCEPFVFACEGAQLVGILHRPAQPRPVGVVVIVGGPQYRIGSHRQFNMVARDLARHGYPVLRFDYRGMGDSEGELRGFEHVTADVRCAIDALLERVPQLRQVVLWALCDGASAASFYAASDARVRGLVLLNPWVRGAQMPARALLFTYYLRRLFDRQAWLSLLRQPAKLVKALGGVTRTVGAAVTQDDAPATSNTAPLPPGASATLLPRVAAGLEQFRGPILVMIALADITGGEFAHYAKHYRPLRRRMHQRDVTWYRLQEADHTFSTRSWRDHVSSRTRQWLDQLPPA